MLISGSVCAQTPAVFPDQFHPTDPLKARIGQLLFYDKISDLAKNYLSKNGDLYFEINQYFVNPKNCIEEFLFYGNKFCFIK